MPSKLSIGRALRSFPPSARALTEYRVASLGRRKSQPEFRLCAELAVPGTTVIDVGASVGNYALAMRKRVTKSGRVVALEPNPAVYAELANSMWCSGVETICAAASNQTGTSTLFVPRSTTGNRMAPLGSMAHASDESVKVAIRTIKLDDLETGPAVSLIKIDVEGHEAAVLAGAVETTLRDRPTFVIEIEQRHLRDRSVSDVAHILLEAGYNCAGILEGLLVPWSEFDVDRHQLQYVLSGTELTPGCEDSYMNNFLFWHPELPVADRTPLPS